MQQLGIFCYSKSVMRFSVVNLHGEKRGEETGSECGECQTQVMLLTQALKEIHIACDERTWNAF